MNRKPSPGYLIPTAVDIVFISILFYLALSRGKDLLADGDTGFHIRAGEYIIKTLSIPRQDLFSHITPTLPWTAHEWLAEVIMELLHRAAGLNAVIVFFSLLIALTYYLLTSDLIRLGGNIFIAIAIAVMAAASSQLHWLARPHIFSLLIMVIWYRILDDHQYRNVNRLYLLPLLMLFWVNLHGGYLAGFILLGIYCSGNFLTAWRAEPDEKSILHAKTRQLFKIALVCLLASLANPIGYKILLFPFHLVGDSFLMDHVHEFLSPNFHEPIYFKYLLLLTIALLVFARRRLNLIELMLLLVFTHMALYSVRYVTLFAIIVAPIILTRADDLLNTFSNQMTGFIKTRAAGFAAINQMARGCLWPVAACVSVPLLMASNGINYQFCEKLKPVAAVEFLMNERISGRMYNNDEFGDYLIYIGWPEYRVFFDGRSDMYGAARMKEYFKVQNFEPGWRDVMQKYGMDWIFCEAKAPLSRYLLASGGWKLIYADKVAHIFVQDLPKYRPLMDRYTNVRPVPIPSGDGDGRSAE